MKNSPCAPRGSGVGALRYDRRSCSTAAFTFSRPPSKKLMDLLVDKYSKHLVIITDGLKGQHGMAVRDVGVIDQNLSGENPSLQVILVEQTFELFQRVLLVKAP